MRLSTISLALFAATAFGADDPASSYDLADLEDKLTSLADLMPTPASGYTLPASITDVANQLPTAPPGMFTDILENIPASVLSGLMNPASRSSLESDFANGDYPQWWKDLPTGVKSYFSEFAAQMTGASLTYNPEGPMATGGASLGNGGDSNGDGTWDLGDQDPDSGAIAMQPSRAVSTSVLVALGILGVALAL